MQLKAENLAITTIKFPEIKDTKHIYTASTKSQRNNNKRLINKQFNPGNLEINTQRILSARNHKINDQSNVIHHLSQQIEELKNENKTLKTQFHRQEKALTKIDLKQTDLPKILEHHEAEVFNLKELLRRSKDNLVVESKQRKDGDTEILRLRDALDRANQLIGDKGLDERSAMQSQIKDLHEKLESKEKLLETSSKHIEHLEKSYKREIYSLKKQMQKCITQSQDLENELEITRNNLKDKEKLLEIQNIYSHRFKILQKTSPGSQNDQLLDKLDFNGLAQKTEGKEKEEVDYSSKISGEIRTNRIDTAKIKDDIRKIVAEEILSGRIKPFEIKNSSPKVIDKTSNNGDSTPQDYCNTDRTGESDIFDQEPITQVQSLVDQDEDPKPYQSHLRQEHIQRQLILEKLNQLETINKQEKIEDSFDLVHSLDNVGNRELIDKTTPAASSQQPSKLYKFSSTVDSLHNGIPVYVNNRSREANKQSKTIISTTTGSKKSQVDASHNQRNNSHLDVTSDDILPQLNADEKKRRESQLLSELFGGDFTPQPVVHGRPYPSGSRQSRTSSLPWQNEQESRQNSDHLRATQSRSNSSEILNQSDDIEHIDL